MAYKVRSSRLKRVEESRAVKSTAFYVVLTIVIIASLLIFGVPALSRLTSLVGNVTRSGIDYTTDTPPPPPPHVEVPAKYTKEEKLKFTGTTRPGQTVLIFFNSDKTEVLANAEGAFTGIFDLSLGENTVYAQVKDQKGQTSTETERFVVVYDTVAPKLELISPENGKSMFGANQKRVQIEGQSEADSRVTINDRIAIVKADGKFTYAATLEPGENVFKIKSTDLAGNETELELKLNYSQ